MSICSLKPNVTREQAVSQFASQGVTRLVRTLTAGPLLSVAELYLPFRLFRARIANRGALEERLVAIDSVAGALDLFQFDHIPNADETLTLETRNHPAAQLGDALAAERLIAKLRRVAYSRGFFRLQDFEIIAEPVSELHIPYWVGFRGSSNHARIAIIDAIRRRFEGAKVRRLVETWLVSNRPVE
jgi:hypothetical protein